VWALIVDRKKLPAGTPFQTGGGTTRLIDPDWIVWADGPDKFKAGTPAIVNIITFAKALRMNQQSGKISFSIKSLKN
jgi:selenocysteine lyase/cysteine desulfurase